jgi:hypothetical protein
MFNWIFKKFQLEPPKPDRDDVENARFLKKEMIDQAAGKVLQEMIKKNQVKIPKPIPLAEFFKNWQKEIEPPTLDIDLKFPKGVYDANAVVGIQVNAKDQLKVPMIPVPIHDYHLLRIIRINMAKGKQTVIDSPDILLTDLDEDECQCEDCLNKDETLVNHLHHINAKVLYDCYGLSKDEIFQLTGCIIK